MKNIVQKWFKKNQMIEEKNINNKMKNYVTDKNKRKREMC